MDCLFCKIATKELPAEIVYEDDRTIAFLDIRPINKGHTLVIPKDHALNIYEIDDERLCDVMKSAKRLAGVVKAATNAEGINIGMNNGPAAGQIVMHAHVHVIPRFADDGHAHWHGEPYAEDELEAFGKLIRDAASAA